MSNSRLPPKFGAPPTKVIFEGVPPGSPLARALFAPRRGEITRFHQKARQNVEIGEQSGQHMHQKLPDGEMSYSYNYGQEILHVRLRKDVVIEAASKLVPTYPERALLAIDILFDQEAYKFQHLYVDFSAANPPEYPVPWYSLYETWQALNYPVTAAIAQPAAGGLEAFGSTVSGGAAPSDPTLLANASYVGGGYLPVSRPLVAYDEDTTRSQADGFFVRTRYPAENVTVDLFAATWTRKVENTPPGIPNGEQFEGPYTYVNPVRFSVQAREFADDPLMYSFIDRTGMSRQRVTEFNNPAYGPGTVELESDEESEFFFGGGNFVVTPEWIDAGGLLADPNTPGMGTLLASTSVTTKTLVTAPEYDDGSSFGSWDRPITDMTKIATVEWLPSDAPRQRPGSAKITLA